MNLYILRHGLAGKQGMGGFKSDSERPLTAKGRQRLRRIAEAMEAMDLSFNVILTSPFARALQTAQIVAEAFDLQNRLTETVYLTPGGSPKALIEQINAIKPRTKNVLLAGHEPYLSKLIALLVAGNTAAAVELKKGGLAKLEIDELRYGQCATMAWLLTPRQMLLMA